ncbi:MAG: hypothetical protein AAF590_03205 [Pseudomonadota bacterium]
MFRTVVIASFMFIWGSPWFEPLRPSPVNVPLANYHHEVKVAARDAVRFVENFEAVRSAQFMQGYFFPQDYFDFVSGRLGE